MLASGCCFGWIFRVSGVGRGKVAAIAVILVTCCALSVVFAIRLASWRCIGAWVSVRSLIDFLGGYFFEQRQEILWGYRKWHGKCL